jgi:hypothetical protein
MEVIFKAKDGTIFYNAEECMKYETILANKEKDWQAWGWDGEPTTKTFHAVVVKLNSEDAAEQFLTAADLDNDGNVEGIEAGDEGWFFYDEGSERYVFIDDTFVNIFRNISAS